MTTPATLFPPPHRLRRWCVLSALLIAGAATLASAQERPRRTPPQTQQGEQRPSEQHQGERQAEQRQAEARGGVLRLLPADSVTEHSIELPGGKLAYRATAGTLPLFDQSGERSAAIFYTAYVASNGGANRPITFAFNGGPGAAAAYLNLGLVGPRVLDFVGNDPAAARLRDNPQTWLAFTDLVLIDPIGTGWSRTVKADGASAFYGVHQDAQALAKAVALYLAKHDRPGAPKYILGESYGGLRSARVAQVLRREQGIIVSGILMVSPLIEGRLTFGGDGFALDAALQLPSLAATELERKGTFSKAALADAERFARTDYLTTLAGPPPTGEAARAFYARVAQITGLPEDTVSRARGFIYDAYVKHLRSGQGKIVSRYDATFAVADPFPEQAGAHAPDPLLDGLTRAYGGAFAAYARDELGFKTEMTYILLASDISGKWDWGRSGRSSVSASDDLRELLALFPSFRLLVAHGYSDMVTPYSATRYVLEHLPPLDDPSRAQLRLYRGGHMFYIDADSRKAFTADAKAFYESAQ
ncbi:MAG TPA: carboxypeptidase [Xanthobacteraceae bacterium]|jgi:carboxypeptidase C (cathepsin A)